MQTVGKNALLQTVFLAILPTGHIFYYFVHWFVITIIIDIW